eukprot:7801878-Lingulodinium_polyedra.AAC.1
MEPTERSGRCLAPRHRRGNDGRAEAERRPKSERDPSSSQETSCRPRKAGAAHARAGNTQRDAWP